MVDEARMEVMIRLAEYESGSGKEAITIQKYHRRDYIALDMIKNFFLITIAYLLLLGLAALVFMSALTGSLNIINLTAFAAWILIGYILMLAVFLTISYFHASRRYREARKSVREYESELKKLDVLYRRKSS